MMFRSDTRLRQLKVIWNYMKASGCYESLLQGISSKTTKQDGIHIVLVPVDLMMLADIDCDVATLITQKPLEGAVLFREVVHELFVAHGFLSDDCSATQVAISIRVNSATLPDLRLVNSQRERYDGFVKLRGVVLGMTATVKYTRSTKFTCPNKACEGHNSNQYIRIHVPGASEKETVGQRFKCSVCFMMLKEIQSQRALSDKLLAEVVPKHLFREGYPLTQANCRYQAVRAIIRDELCHLIQLGEQYEMTGTRRLDFEAENITGMLEVNNLIPMKSALICHSLSSSEMIAMLPSNVQRLCARWGKVPFTLPHIMALRLADQVVPPSCFFKLKLLLLISLVLPSDILPLLMLVVSSETHLVERLLEFCSKLASHCARHSTLSTMGAKASARRYSWSPYFIQAGSLVLASHGVCVVGDILGLKRTDKMELQAALSESRVQVTLEAKHTGGLPHVLTLPLSCHVWAFASSDTVGVGADIPPALLDAFSIVSYCDTMDSASVDITEELVSNMVISSMAGETCYTKIGQTGTVSHDSGEEKVSLDSLKQYIAVARGQKSIMTVEAEWLLTSYVRAARLARSVASLVGSAVPVSAMQALQALAHGLCRLCLRQEVLETDAVMAVCLYEETLSARYGMSGLNVFPEPHLPAGIAETFITTQMPTVMHKFHSRLLSFCSGAVFTTANEE